jgi:MFS family permease
LEEQFHVDPKSMLGALYKGGPLWMGALGCLIGGWLTDSFIRRTGNRKWGRRLFGVIGHSLCALCWLSCLVAPSVFFFFLAISQAAFWNDVTMASSWATCQDIGKRYAAIVAGCMNTIGNLGGAVAGYLTAVVLDGPSYFYALNHKIPLELLTEEQKAGCLHVGWQINFVTFGLVYFLAVVLWLRVDSTRPIFSDSDQ